MKMFTIFGDTHRVYFQNLDWKPLSEEFQNVVSELRKNGCSIGPKKEVCTADVYTCLALPERLEFLLIYDDTDDGTCIYFEDDRVFERLKTIFEYIE